MLVDNEENIVRKVMSGEIPIGDWYSDHFQPNYLNYIQKKLSYITYMVQLNALAYVQII